MRTVKSERFDYGADLGGSILRDRLWFFVAYNRVTLDGDLSRVTSSRFVSKDDRFPFDAAEDLYSGKLTWNARTTTSLVGTVFADPSETSGAAAADPRQGLSFQVRPITRPDPSTWFSTRSKGGTDYGLRLTELFGSRALATFQWSNHRDRNSVSADDTIQYVDATCAGGTRELPCTPPQEANTVYGGFGNIGPTGASSRRQYAGSFIVFAGHHELKMGADYMDGRTNLVQRRTGGQTVTIFNRWGETYYRHQYAAASPTDLTPIDATPRRAQVIDYGRYLQDSWRLDPGLTVNIGLRWDGESTRDYRGQEVWRLADGWQPRLGLVWDPWRNGKSKVHAFAGRFSYAFPTIAAWLAFAGGTGVTSFNFDPVNVEHDPNVYGVARRISSGSTASAVDEGIEGTYQDELTVGIERLLAPTLTIGVKGTYRNLGTALEDRCDLDYSDPEINTYECAFINPGSSARYASGESPTCDRHYLAPGGQRCSPSGAPTPNARRIYRGIEILARHFVPDRLWIQASYIYSSLRGNYDGGVSQVFEQTVGQARPGVTWDFTAEDIWHNSYGTLTLDRPHRFRLDGYWTSPLRLSVGLQAFIESGAPLNKFGFHSMLGPSIFLVSRGSAGRLPTLWEANLTASYPISVGPVTATLQGYVYNIFNNQIATAVDEAWTIEPPAGYPATALDPNQERDNPNYGKVTSRSAPRSFRAALRVSF
jgi:hypothetical protein